MHYHQLINFNYTTYDMGRDRDIIHVGNPNCDIMLLADEDAAYPFWFARIQSIFHVDCVLYPRKGDAATMPTNHRVNVLWARFFELKSDLRPWRLPQVVFIERNENNVIAPEMGFVDPAMVIRGAHLVPAFAHGQRGPAFKSLVEPEKATWNSYYFNMFGFL